MTTNERGAQAEAAPLALATVRANGPATKAFRHAAANGALKRQGC